VSLNVASWNRISDWLHQLEGLRRAGLTLKAGDADVISRLEHARGAPLRLRGGSAPDLQRRVLMFEIIC
jgi:hypothetical protein